MIIISENKKNHALIKKFLLEVDDYGNDESQYVDFYDAFVDDTLLDTEIIHDETPVTEPQIKKVSIKKPKMNKLKRMMTYFGVTIPIAVAAKYFDICNNVNNKEELIKISEYIEDANKGKINSEVAYKILSSDEQENKTIKKIENKSEKIANNTDPQEKNEKTLAKPIENKKNNKIKEISMERIKKFENFKPFPYQDRSGVSIGFGTQFMTKGKASKLKKDGNWKNIIYKKLGYSDAAIKKQKKDKKYIAKIKEEIKSYVGKTNKRIDELEARKNSKVKGTNRYHFPEEERKRLEKKISHLKSRIDAVYDRGILTLEEAIKCFELDVQKAYDKAKSDFENAFEKMDHDVIIVIIDMNYNVGLSFLQNIYTDFNEHLVNYSEEIIKKNPNTKELIKHLKLAAKEISPEGAPKYYRQNKDRATENYSLLLEAIKKLETSINENKSLKIIYKNLFS